MSLQGEISQSLEQSLERAINQLEQDKTLEVLEKKRLMCVWGFVAILAVEIGITILGAHLGWWKNHINAQGKSSNPAQLWFFLCAGMASAPFFYFNMIARNAILPVLVRSINNSLKWSNKIDHPDWLYVESGFIQPSGLVGLYDGKIVSDFVTGSVNCVGLSILGLELSLGSGKNKTVKFCGSVTCVRLVKPASVRLVLRSNYLTFFHNFHGLQEIGIPSQEFSRLYKAYGSDQVLARVLLNPAAIMNLVTLHNATVHGRVEISLMDNGLGIFIHGPKEFTPSSLFKSVYKFDAERRVLTQIFSILALAEILTRDWKLDTEKPAVTP
jgi:Protein of unknown function (DUF3137)